MAVDLTIDELGARGDGVARTAGRTIYVEGALPGEAVSAEVTGDRGRLLAIARPSPERTEPICSYFDCCGGCAAQHMAVPLYTHWKTAAIATALARAGIGTPLAPLVDAAGSGRRRVILHARTHGGRASVGFMAPRSHDLIAIDQCPVLTPALARAPGVARQLAQLLARFDKPLDLQLTATLTGLDVDIRGLGRKAPGEQLDAARLALVEAAERLDLARLALHGDILVERRPPLLAMGRATVVPPPGGFLQATEAGEQILADLVLAGLGEARGAGKGRNRPLRVADCFCGCGPFTLRLAEQAEVHAVEIDAAALAALDRARRGAPGLKPIRLEQRDLFRRPLLPPEIDRFDALVFDPPRAGAEALVRQMAASRLPLAVAVSCDAASFARDAAILAAAGFVARCIVPVDQFRYSAHTEIVGVFVREKAKR
ncbi:class I SAM-dependent RNA methyltransferase [Chelatococcus reniformis]|uniref:RNA methyltransferase n=1 Tax=Chelatococcus reniformis TaxID=1494448 RepID=A0A916XBN3_9HYPH|nr:class I SAM-dependent RNA methyltransferase [Chelatococcus reniformis]GGC62028.1 putative RNA methyltransferase [Chelatococcus reniformis]